MVREVREAIMWFMTMVEEDGIRRVSGFAGEEDWTRW